MSRLTGCLFAGLVGLSLMQGVSAAPPSPVHWQKDLKSAHRLSVAQNKPILIVFSADWCTYCHKLERNVINQPEMAAYINANFIPVHLDADRDKKVAEILEVESLPCTVVLSPNADLLGKFKGYTDAAKFTANLTKATDYYQELQTAAATGETVTR